MAFLKVDKASVTKEDVSVPDAPDIPILDNTEYKEKVLSSFRRCLNRTGKGGHQVDVYYSYSPKRITTTPRAKSTFPDSYMAASFFMASFNIIMTEAFKVIKTLNGFNRRNHDRSVIYRNGHLDKSRLPANVAHLFNNTTVITEKYETVQACVIVEKKLLKEMLRFIKIVQGCVPSDYIKDGKKLPKAQQLLKIKIRDFIRMSTGARLRILSQTVSIKLRTLYVFINVKKDIGNLGREYHLLTNLARADRDMISNLYGYDFESALQTILLEVMSELNQADSYGITSNYVKNKDDVREYVMGTLGVDKDTAKKVITAAYQGGSLNGLKKIIKYSPSKTQREGMEALYSETKIIMERLLQVSSTKFTASKSILGNHFQTARWYAMKRTSKKQKIVDDFSLEYYNKYVDKFGNQDAGKFAKSYMFYFWTYFEGEARKILSKHLKQPITLHDAVYTQDKTSFDSMVVEDVEDEIYQKIGIPLKLGTA